MGEIADMMLDGTLDCVTGEYIGDPCGYPRTLEGDETHATAVKRKKRRKKNRRNKERVVSEAEFTPGHWVEIPLSPYIVEVDGGIEIADVSASSLANATANAHLISAAPDLYYALSDFVEYERLMETGDDVAAMLKYADLREKAAKALTKARGEA